MDFCLCIDKCTKTPAGTTTTIPVSACPRCGIIVKSGKMSCCGRGGSWFKNCGGGNKKRQHTWYQGIRACEVRSHSKTVIDQQLNRAQQKKDIDYSKGAGMANSKSVVTASKTFTFTSSVNISTPMSDTTSMITSTHTSDNDLITTSAQTLMTNFPTGKISITSSTYTSVSTSMTTQECVNLLKIKNTLSVLFIITFQWVC